MNRQICELPAFHEQVIEVSMTKEERLIYE